MQEVAQEVVPTDNYAALPLNERPAWAAAVLAHLNQAVEPLPQVQDVIRIARSSVPGQWYSAKEAFYAVRELQAQPQSPLHLSVLQFAEKVAALTYEAYQDMIDKVFYNPTTAITGHEHNLEMAILLNQITAKVNNPEFAAKAQMLFNNK
jgi:hypothetical protein